MPKQTLKRTRDAAATRAAILVSARRTFSDAGYDGAGVREIAAGAGVTAMMVNRYFGSKEALFAEVVADTMRAPVILATENLASADIAIAFAQSLVNLTSEGESPLDGFLILFRSASSDMAAAIAREQIEKVHLKTAIITLGDIDYAKERAAIFLSLVAGFQMMRQMIGLKALVDADKNILVVILQPLLTQLLGKRD